MAARKTLAQRLFSITKFANQTLTNCRISSSAIRARASSSPSKANIAPDPGEDGMFRRFIHKRAVLSPEVRALPVGDALREKLRSMDISKDRIRLEGLAPPPTAAPKGTELSLEKEELTAEAAKKLLWVAQMEAVKTTLRGIGKSWIPYSEFVRICEEACLDPEQGPAVAKVLDESGNVVVLGNMVFLRPEQVANTIQSLMPLGGVNPNDPRKRELEDMEKEKAAIDRKAESLVRRELWGGLLFLMVQTAGFMRLTFWELSWDVMEPICFYVTSMYFMAGYAFFLRTSKEPSFEGYFQSRFRSKQKKLIKAKNFDVERYNELRRALFPHSPPYQQQSFSSGLQFHPLDH